MPLKMVRKRKDLDINTLQIIFMVKIIQKC